MMLESGNHMSSHNSNTFTLTLPPEMRYANANLYVNNRLVSLGSCKIIGYNGRTAEVTISSSPIIDAIHPWLNDLTAMSKMLTRELKLPHLPKVSGNAKDRRKARRRVFWVKSRILGYDKTRHCEECLEAFELQQRYKSHSSERNV